jgi:hypothetical protein
MVKVLEDELREEKIKQAVNLYYDKFGTDKSVTVNEAAAKYGIKGIELHMYIAARTDDGLGMPETREEAQSYRNKL